MPDHVLVVEDDSDLAEVLAMMLTTHGYQAEVAHDGEEALAAVSARMPSLILLDMLMPKMNGWEFVREFVARHGHAAPIVVVSASENARARAAEVSADAVLSKPFDVKQLIEIVDRLLRPATPPAPQVPPGAGRGPAA